MANSGFKEFYTIKTEGYERPKEDFFETPVEATKALLAHVIIPKEITLWEPSVGRGAISNVLKKYCTSNIVETDLVDRGIGTGGVDFLNKEAVKPFIPADRFWIISNPPYNIADDYIRKCFEYGAERIILLLRHAYSESAKKREDILSNGHLLRELLIKERLKMSPDGWEGKKQSSMYNHAWFIWDKNYSSPNSEEFIIRRISIKDGMAL